MSAINAVRCHCGKPADTGTYGGNFCREHADDVPGACDFCLVHAPEFAYPCADFPVGFAPGDDGATTLGFMSRGHWGACLTCRSMIDAGNWDALAARAASTMALPKEVAVPAVLGLHRLFQAHRRGAAVAVPPGMHKSEVRRLLDGPGGEPRPDGQHRKTRACGRCGAPSVGAYGAENGGPSDPPGA